MTSPSKASVRSNMHALRGISGIGLGMFFRDDQLRADHMLDKPGKRTSLFDGKDEPEQSRRDQFRRMQMVAIGVRDIAGFDGFSPRSDEQVAVRHGAVSSSQRNAHPIPSGYYRAASVSRDTKIPPPVDNREGA